MSPVHRHTIHAAAFALSFLIASPATAQGAAPAAPTASERASASAPAVASRVAPTPDNATVGVRRISEAGSGEIALRQGREPRPVALMIVGGATMLVGTVIGGDAGTIVTIGGAVVFLVGVFRYVQ